MRYRTLGSSDLQVSEISLGSWLTYAGGIDADATRACTEAAFDAGINFFDTANVYGQGAAETAWGEILSAHPRDSYILATKVWGPMSDDPADKGLSPAQIAKQIDASLTRLKTDYVDLYQAHRFDPSVPIEDTIEAFQKVVEQGKARSSASASGPPSRSRQRSTSPAPTCSSPPSRSTPCCGRPPRPRSSASAPRTASPRSSGPPSPRAS